MSFGRFGNQSNASASPIESALTTGIYVNNVFKYEYFDPNLDVKDNISYVYQERMTLGANYYFNDKVRLQINYQANIQTVINVDDDALIAQIQVKF